MGGPFTFKQQPTSWEFETDDLNDRVMEIIATDLQARLRGRLDHGLYGSAAVGASRTTVRNEEGRLEIRVEPRESVGESPSDLFQSSNEPPFVKNGQLIFRQVEAEEFSKQRHAKVKQAFKESVEMHFVQSLIDSSKRIDLEKPIVE